eukprot:6115136-Heterocapsa_arctica.AAC.1
MDNPIFAKSYDEKVEHDKSIKEVERLTLEMQGAEKRKHLVSSVKNDLAKTQGELDADIQRVRGDLYNSMYQEHHEKQEQLTQNRYAYNVAETNRMNIALKDRSDWELQNLRWSIASQTETA